MNDSSPQAQAEKKARNLERLKAWLDKSSWQLILATVLIMGLADYKLLLTLVQYTSYAFLVGGATIIISRVTFPGIKLTEFVDRAKQGDRAAATVVGALLVYCALVFLGIVFWVK